MSCSSPRPVRILHTSRLNSLTQSGLWGLIGYPLNGVSRSIEKSYGNNRQDYIIFSRIRQGDADLAAASDEEKAQILAKWRVVQQKSKQARAWRAMPCH